MSSILTLLEQSEKEGGLEIDKEQAGQIEGLEETLAGQGSAAQIRNLLIQAGMNKEILDQISDEVLIESYQEVLQNN